MIVMEGLMLFPPDRGTIIGRSLWKQRYVVLGTGSRASNDQQPQTDSSGRGAAARKGGLKNTSSRPSLVDVSQPEPQGNKLYITIYKAKGDWEYLQQHAVSAFKTCEVRHIQHKKQSPSLPTLLLELKPDSIADKQRKRRSSRTGGLSSSKDTHSNILLFRSVPDEQHNIYDWQMNIKPLLTPDDIEEGPLSPMSPAFNFSNPFANRDARTPSAQRPELQQRGSHQNTYPHAPTPRERPYAMISPSPSLRSRRSDLSSQASSQPPMGFTSSHPQSYTTLPTDLPSPASTSGYDNQFIEGWTSAQGRSSALSSHTRGSNSIASAVQPPLVASTPPGPRETILDRAFQMRCIPGSDRVPDKDEEKISSIARFEALMREVDERKQAKALAKSPTHERQNWGLEEESEESSEGEPEEDEDELGMSDEDVAIPTPAQRALDYISGRRTPLPTTRPLSPAPRSPPIPFLNSQAMSAFHGHSSGGGLRPRTGTTSSRNGEGRPNSFALPSRSQSTTTIPTLQHQDFAPAVSSNQNLKATDQKEKRRSSTSVKRLSFTEFAKRLSSTSSLLLVQTNASSSSGRGDGSGRVSSEFGADEDRTGMGMRGGAGTAAEMMGGSNRDKRCGWRGSVGVFGGEGGFL
ncbi:uncharacterized protein LY89DRAFT_731309 [Mollisia scopiformis]|uniref:Uncharacterized protein n=1 Tax=Mollisia scopiformis TaxID=149040 RepID=A0A194XIY1_MOLSC|nr:uncharacterized protein LY89DRAFT_731309 [Mollisia scopiformis]KUJ20074.1 hypothetical protein LY89DRAFT_731309 [Mollisia scopiformis]